MSELIQFGDNTAKIPTVGTGLMLRTLLKNPLDMWPFQVDFIKFMKSTFLTVTPLLVIIKSMNDSKMPIKAYWEKLVLLKTK